MGIPAARNIAIADSKIVRCERSTLELCSSVYDAEYVL